MLKSNGKHSNNPFIYHGLGGGLYLYYRLYELAKRSHHYYAFIAIYQANAKMIFEQIF